MALPTKLSNTASRNGPLPMGNSSDDSHSRFAGQRLTFDSFNTLATGSARCHRKSAFGRLNLTVNVASSTISKPSSSRASPLATSSAPDIAPRTIDARDEFVSGRNARSQLHLTSSEVSGVPSLKRTSSRNLNV